MWAANRPAPARNQFRRKKNWRACLPVIEKLREKIPAFISIDTSKAEVARAALEAGASIINDVTGGRGDPEMMTLAAEKRSRLHHHAHAGHAANDADAIRTTTMSSRKWLIFFDNNMRAP